MAPSFPPAIVGTKRPRSKLPRRSRIPPPPIVAGTNSKKLVSSSSSSCFASELTFDSTANFAGSAVPRRPRSSRGSFPGGDFRRITRSYAKKLRSEPETSDLAVSEVSHVSGAAAPSKIPNSVRIGGKEVSGGLDLCSDLACSEQLSSGDDDDREIESEFFYGNSEGDYSSDYSLSDLFGSDDEDCFSGRSDESSDENSSAPSATFSFFLQLMQQFVRSSSFSPDLKVTKPSRKFVDEDFLEFTVLVFDDSEDEESYRRIRCREKKEVALSDLAAEYYDSSSEFGDLVLQQRLRMVNWMVEHSKTKELHHETLFLGVTMMDRFLSRGYFQSERNLQLLGIASITLAARLEENQPYNNIRQKSFTVGRSDYSRSEVVSMEWLLLEVLNFQCLLPTTHNFLWFYLKAAKADMEVESLARYLAVLSLLDHKRLCFWPSTVAASLVILACLATNRDTSCLKVMETHVRTKSDDLPECIQSLEWLVKFAC
ncbi:cyclin-SDS-like [Iris pallida]|uniref:Cyclin-SDS-like n=1 Tax=Iris pallida TaxID=29817 RepID=A0AAX6I5J9_IRIPA|nr:cyclin-SDS-like [Iris pallida]KAJ6848462.1 cyclin-SDS-like [Iris pallida]